MKTNDEIYEMLERLERTLLAVTPFRRLPLDLQKRAAELQRSHTARTDPAEREEIAMREFEKMLALPNFKRESAKWPKALISRDFNREGIPGRWATVKLPVVPLSGLVNRCIQRAVFNIMPGEITPQDNAIAAVRKLGLVITTLGKLGCGEGQADVRVVHRKGFEMPDEMFVLVSEEIQPGSLSKPQKPELSPLQKKAIENMARDKANGYVEEELGEEEEEEEPAPPPIRKPKDDGITFDWSSVGKEEIFEESDCAAGLASIPGRDDEEEVDIEDVHDSGKGSSPWQKTLSDTTDDVDEDDDWGPDEIEFDNPVREQFEREATEAAAREQAKLDSGDYFLLDGKVTKKKGR
jgi:hypothetical protein